MTDQNKIANYEKSKILKESLRIIDKLGECEIDDLDMNELEELINKAKKLKRNRFFKL